MHYWIKYLTFLPGEETVKAVQTYLHDVENIGGDIISVSHCVTKDSTTYVVCYKATRKIS